ncbi:uncharacterized protein LOC126703148 isoform X1 [Quercus robur]|uniref:uncharacterized protein LOC126703148 isoform X1 n=1 Tax=Quercus robur TaxID=38942 RepID=UPI00216175CC|nr:uncharacterized protein LOC126703148 isoform X1 [Quercus robur]
MAVEAAPSAPWCRTSKRITSSLPPLPILLSPSTTLFFRQALPGSSATTATASPPSPLAPTPLASLLDPSITPSSSTNFSLVENLHLNSQDHLLCFFSRNHLLVSYIKCTLYFTS